MYYMFHNYEIIDNLSVATEKEIIIINGEHHYFSIEDLDDDKIWTIISKTDRTAFVTIKSIDKKVIQYIVQRNINFDELAKVPIDVLSNEDKIIIKKAFDFAQLIDDSKDAICY